MSTITNGMSSEAKSSVKECVISLKTPKGTRDFTPKMMAIREKVIDAITKCFQKYGAEQIDTPVFETKETLVGKYGDESKLIYDLADQGGEILSLRYDLTVPFARYLALNKIDKMKRFHIAKVYRRDNPAMNRGRFREFYQCDFDIAGQYDSMLADIEVVQVCIECLEKLDIGNFTVKINHRKIIDGIMKICGVPCEKIRTVSSSIDKLDKTPWEDVQKELVEEKNISLDVVLKIKDFVKLTGNISIIQTLKETIDKENNTNLHDGLDDLILLDKYAKLMKIDHHLVYDMSLARGLDYYTGLIYEAIAICDNESSSNETTAVGSIAGGGRYDNLVGMFDRKNRVVPCIGVSIGIERVFTLLEKKFSRENVKIRTTKTEVYVASAQKKMLEERLKVVQLLRSSDIKNNPKLLNQFQYCEENEIPLCIVLGQDEISKGVVKLRETLSRKEKIVDNSNVVEEIKSFLGKI